jgi:hydrogenase maturation protease
MTDGPTAARRRVVVIGIGNEFRRDDGVGPAVLSRLREQAPTDTVQVVTSDGEPASLIEAWTGASLAVIVDAVLADPPNPGRLYRLVLDRQAFADVRQFSSHGLGLDAAIGLAQALDRMPDRLIIHAVEAADVSHGVGFTPAVAAAVAPVTAAVVRDLLSACGTSTRQV